MLPEKDPDRNRRVYAILLAGGAGTRMKASVNKVLLPVAGIPCIRRSAEALLPFADEMILVGCPEEKDALMQALDAKDIIFASGGKTRQESVYNGLQKLRDRDADSIVLIHDGARCLVDRETISRVILSAELHGSGVAAIPVTDTLREADDNLVGGKTLPRENLFAMQTPQAFLLENLIRAFDVAVRDGFTGTDDASVMAHAGFPVHLSTGNRMNLKLTTREDYQMSVACAAYGIPQLRVGQGYDVHQLVENRKLILCGVDVPFEKGLLGHSDADVALHALMDALLGAAGLGDIGRHFPDSDPAYLNADSMKLLSSVLEKLLKAGFQPVNADITIIAQKPKLAPFIPLMKEKLASALGLPDSYINVKATTTEHLGFEGRMEGISASAVCLIRKTDPDLFQV